MTPIDGPEEQQDSISALDRAAEGGAETKDILKPACSNSLIADKESAQKELRRHELLALLSCFIFPLLAAWLLHGIRSQLTRPSEGLVSNYNLTIFILVAEIRPLSHMIKMIQRRTLFLQRRVNADVLLESARSDSRQVRDLSSRLEEIEAHIADRIADTGETADEQAGNQLAAKASELVTSDMKKTVQPELDALNRAMRRYEKRTTISSVQIEARLQDLEARLNDVVALAAAAQRNVDRRPNTYIVILSNWICAAVVLPVRYLMYVVSLPGKLVTTALAVPNRYMRKRLKSQVTKEGRASRRAPVRPNERERRSKP